MHHLTSFSDSCFFTEDSNTFLFSLVNPSGSKPVKISKNPRVRVGILPNKNLGPCIGTRGGYNLKTWKSDLHDNFKCGVFFGTQAFLTPANVDLSTYVIGGMDGVRVSELEVFKVSF